MTVRFITLGCKTNIYESEAMAQLFEAAGYTVVSSGSADICVINTCTVTGTGASKSLKQIRRARRENPNAVLAVTGCLAQTEADRLREAENIDVLIGVSGRDKIVSLCEAAQGGKRTDRVEDISRTARFEELGIVHRQRRIRAEIKIEDGCNNFCSYCKIPYARGPVRSRNIDKIAEEAAAIAADGYSEIVLTGIHIGSYGRDLKDGTGLIDVMETVSRSAPGLRLRLGSLEPVMITEEFTRRAAELGGLCPQFHLSLQSGCDRTLSAMHRHYSAEEYRRGVANLRTAFPGSAITTDLIVGFPGETEADFDATMALVRRVGFAEMHVFPYSVRPGTRAAQMPEQLTHAVKNARAARAQAAAEEMQLQYLDAQAGRTLPVLFETEQPDGRWQGHSANYCEVLTPGQSLHGIMKNVQITAREGKKSVGIIV